MHIYLDLVAVATAVIAVWLALKESRRNGSVLIKIRQCKSVGCQSVDENGENVFYEFRVEIRNEGISLHDVKVGLGFREPDGRGWVSLALNSFDGGKGEFARGMIAAFGLKSYQMDKHQIGLLSMLEDPGAQDAEIWISSQGYKATSFSVGSRWDRFKRRWNRFADRVNRMTEHKTGRNKDVVDRFNLLPVHLSLEYPVKHFRDDCWQDWQKKNPSDSIGSGHLQ